MFMKVRNKYKEIIYRIYRICAFVLKLSQNDKEMKIPESELCSPLGEARG